jgi:hypothetical protein
MWFYILALLNAFVAVAGVLGAVFMSKKGSTAFLVALLVQGTIGFVNAWFLFLVCNRGLKVDGFQTFTVGPLAGQSIVMPSRQ